MKWVKRVYEIRQEERTLHVNEESWIQFTNVTQAAAGLAEADWSRLVSLVVISPCCVWFLNLRKASLGYKQCRWKAGVGLSKA